MNTETRTTAPIYSDLNLAAHDVCCAAKHAIIVGGASIMFLSPAADGSGSVMTKNQHRDIARILAGVPNGETLRVSFQAAAPRSADAVLGALEAAGFKVRAVARHEDTPIGRPGKEKIMRDGMLAFTAPATIEDEIAVLGQNIASLLFSPFLG